MVRYKKHEVRYGDTMQSIAQLETGEVNDWIKIAEYNHLKYPYIVYSREEKMQDLEHLVTLGDEIIIPIQQSILDNDVYKMSRRDQDFILSLALGRDLDMTSKPQYYEDYGTSDELFELNHNGIGDLKTCQGADNIRQATLSRLMTAKGSLILHPEYGSNLHNLFGKTTLEQMKVISLEVTSTVLKDTRVTECVLVEHYIKGDVYYGEFKATIHTLKDQFEFIVTSDATGSIIVM